MVTKMFFCWQKCWFIFVLATIMANMRPVAKAFPMQNTSTTAFTQPSSISPSISSTTTPSMTVLRNLRSSVAEPTMINTQASNISPTPYLSQLPSSRVTKPVTVTQIPSVTSYPSSANSSSTAAPTTARRTGKDNYILVFSVSGVALLLLIFISVVVFQYTRNRRRRIRKPREITILGHHDNGPVDLDDVCHTVPFGVQCGLSSSRQESFKFGDSVYCNDLAVNDEITRDITDRRAIPAVRKSLKAEHQINASIAPGIAKQCIPVEGGTLRNDGITLQIGPGCLTKDTQITMITNKDNFSFQSLLDLGLLSSYPRVIEFLPDGLKFESPADLTVHLDDAIPPEQELFALHGTYSIENERIIWTVVTDDTRVNGQYVNMKINGFSFYTFIMSRRGGLARLLSHLNNSFNCHAVALYRRTPTYVDVAVVLVSEFVETSSEVTMMVEENEYRKCETGALKRVDTQHTLEMCVEFPGIDTGDPHIFKIDVTQLDSRGMVIGQFKKIKQDIPTSGEIVICEIQKRSKANLWTLDVPEEPSAPPSSDNPGTDGTDDPGTDGTDDPDTDTELPTVVMRKTKLTGREIARLSIDMWMMDWDSLAGLLDIPYAEREEMRFNQANDCHWNAKKILSMFNETKDFCRDSLKKCLDEIGRGDLIAKMKAQEQDEPTIVDTPNNNNARDVVLRDTRLSPREMYRLSREIIDWDSLAGLMDITMAERDNIRTNKVYPNIKSRAEKVLSIFNNRSTFCRKELSEHLKELKLFNLEDIMINGQYRIPL